MKTIKVPEPVSINTGNKPLEITFSTFVISVLNDKRFTQGYQAISAAAEMEKSVMDTQPGDEWNIDTAHYDLLKAAVEDPQPNPEHGYAGGWGFIAPVQRKLLPMADAIRNIQK